MITSTNIVLNNLSFTMDRLKILEEEQDVLNSSLISLTTHFAQVDLFYY